MRRSWLAPAVALLVAACGSGPGDAVGTSTAPSSTTSTAAATTTTGTPPESTTTPTTTAATTTAWSPFRGDGTLTALPALAYWMGPVDGTAADVPWNAIGPDWLLLDVGTYTPMGSALYLLDADDRLYLLGGTRGVGDWSPDGRAILFGAEDGVVTLDLLTGEQGVIEVAAVGEDQVSARFTFDGSAVVVRRVSSDRTVSIGLYRRDGTLVRSLLDADFSDASEVEWEWPSWLYLQDGTVVLADPDGVRRVSAAGEPVRELDAPGLACQVTREWSDDAVLVSCIDPIYAASEIAACWPRSGRGLWAVPLDGGPGSRIGPAVGPGGDCEQAGGYEEPMADALQLGDTLLVQTSGCCEAGDVAIYLPSGRVLTRLFGSVPWLVGSRHGKVVVVGYGPPLLAEVAADGSVLPIRPDLARFSSEVSAVNAISLTDPAGA